MNNKSELANLADSESFMSSTASACDKSYISRDDASVSTQVVEAGPGVFNFDKPGVPALYKCIQSKKWPDVIRFANAYPSQAAAWVFRKEKNGNLRWKLLPLHAALIFQSPEKVISSILAAYPHAAQSRDDQGMLPIHLAFRNGASEGTIKTLLVAYPKSINVKDRKGRVPLVLAQASASPNKDAFLHLLERGPSYYAVAAAATERAAVTTEQKALYDAKLKQVEEEYKEDVTTMEEKYEKEYDSLMKKHTELKLNSEDWKRTNIELKYQSKIMKSKLESKIGVDEYVKQLSVEKDRFQVTYREEKERGDKLHAKVQELELENSRIVGLKDELKNLKGQLDNVANATICKNLTCVERAGDYKEKIEFYKTEVATQKATIDVLESQLKLKMASEQSLASQLGDLANNMASTSQSNSATAATYMNREAELMQEKIILKSKIKGLVMKLNTVAVVMDNMAVEQMTFKETATKSEESMRVIEEQHQALVQATLKQEDKFEAAKRQRDEMIASLAVQGDSLRLATTEMEKNQTAIAVQEESLVANKEERAEMHAIMMKQNEDLLNTIVEINEVIKGADPEIGNIIPSNPNRITLTTTPIKDQAITPRKDSLTTPSTARQATPYEERQMLPLEERWDTPRGEHEDVREPEQNHTFVEAVNLTHRVEHLETNIDTDPEHNTYYGKMSKSALRDNTIMIQPEICLVHCDHKFDPVMIGRARSSDELTLDSRLEARLD